MSELILNTPIPSSERRKEVVGVLSPDKLRLEWHTVANARDLVRAGWMQLPDDVCEVCYGKGHDGNGELCWHCDGEGVNPN